MLGELMVFLSGVFQNEMSFLWAWGKGERKKVYLYQSVDQALYNP